MTLDTRVLRQTGIEGQKHRSYAHWGLIDEVKLIKAREDEHTGRVEEGDSETRGQMSTSTYNRNENKR